jgi:hypothetical protein
MKSCCNCAVLKLSAGIAKIAVPTAVEIGSKR